MSVRPRLALDRALLGKISGATFACLLFTATVVAAPSAAAPAGLAERYGKLPLGFEANRGQTDGRVKFLSRGLGYTLFLTEREAVLSLQHHQASPDPAPAAGLRRPSGAEATPRKPATPPAVLRMRLLGANAHSAISGVEPLPGVANYFQGNDPSEWRTSVPSYAKVRYQDVYPGVDLLYYGNQGSLEYDFVLAPGAAVESVHLGFAGAGSIRIDKTNGDLLLRAGGEEVRFHRPVAYQPADAVTARRPVEAHYVIEAGHRVRFSVAAYDPSRALVIDPTLSYSTYLGGSSNDYATSIAVDSAGNAYVTGYTTSVDFPVASALQPTCSDGCAFADAFITKLNPTGTALVYSTYIGGKGNDYGNGIAVDAAGDVYVVGQTYSNNFPVTPGVLQSKCGGTSCASGDAFVLELDPSGATLLYSTYLGGKSSNQGNAIVLDSSGDAYVVGYTSSTDFPTTPGVVQGTCNCSSKADLFISEIKPGGTALVYSTYLGGSDLDVGYSIALDSSKNAYVTGYTQSTDFPTTSGAFQTQKNAQQAAFVSKLNSTATALIYSTYLGGNTTATTPCEACATTITVDSTGAAFVCGLTAESNFPITAGAYQTTFKSSSKGHDAFITKFNTDGTALDFSTYLGGTGDDGATGLKLDASGNVWVKGNTKSANFPVTGGTFQTANAGDFDAYVAELDPTGSQLLYSTYLGGAGTEFGGATGMLALGDQDPPNVYAITYTNSTNFPVTTGAFQTTNAGSNDATVSLFVPSPNAGLSPASLDFGVWLVKTTSTPLTVTLTDTGNQALSITKISASGDYAQTNDCGSSLAVGASCTITVTFTPTKAHVRTGTLSVTDNGPGSPHAVSLTGKGTYVTLSATSLDFGAVTVGTTGPPQTITLTNAGTGALSVTSITLTGKNPSNYSQSNTCGSSVAGGASCTITVTFTPSATGIRTASVTIKDSGGGSPQTVSLTGTGQ